MKKTFEHLQQEILEFFCNDNESIAELIIEIKSELFEFYCTSEYTEENVKRITGRIAFSLILINKELNEKPLVILDNQPTFDSVVSQQNEKIDFDTSIDCLCYAWHNVRTTRQETIYNILLNIIYLLDNGEVFNGCLVDVTECLERFWEINRPIYKFRKKKDKRHY